MSEPSAHQCFSARLRPGGAGNARAHVFYQAAPVRGQGVTTISLRLPLLTISEEINVPFDVAKRIAEILNAHWETHGQPDHDPKYCTVEYVTELQERLVDAQAKLGDALHKLFLSRHPGLDPGSSAPLEVVPADVANLVVAAREAWEEHGTSGDALDRALEAFAGRVPFENQPEERTCTECGTGLRDHEQGWCTACTLGADA